MIRYDNESPADALERWRRQFTDRRTIPAQMLDEAHALVLAAISEQAAEHRGQLEMLEEQHARELERAGQRETRLRERAERAEAAEKAYRTQQTNLREQRETVDDGVQVRISAPTFRSYGDRDMVRPWTLGELDQVLYRLRSAGAGDDTEVRFARERVEACVPFPEMVLDHRPAAPPPATTDRPPRAALVANRLLDNARLGAVVLVVAALAAVAAVIFG